MLEIDLAQGVVKNLTRGLTFKATPIPDMLMEILRKGGLVNYLKERRLSQ